LDSQEPQGKKVIAKENRNIIDHYHYWRHEAILSDLDTRRNNFTVLCCNLYNDFNIATVIRNANAFLSKKVIVYGNKKYDRRGTVGTHHYTHLEYILNKEMLIDFLLQNNFYRIVGVDNVEKAVSLPKYDWGSPKKDQEILMIFGQEQVGIPEDILDLCDDVVYIPQYGSVRSLNVGTASGIAMYDYATKVVENGDIVDVEKTA
jgi:tRNA G18 (ribose-2'-O)-methylase SpoU